MRCRKNVRKLIEEYNLAANKADTDLSRFVSAVLALKAAPSQLPPPHTQASRYDDYVYIHQQSMAGHPVNDPGPHPGHKGPMFFPWHREYLRQFELDLRAVSGDPTICLPYWDFTRDQSAADPGYPFIDAFLGGDGVGASNQVQTGPFAFANGWALTLGASTALQRDFAAGVGSLPSTGAVTEALNETTYDDEPFNWDAPASSSFRNRVEGWVGPQAGPDIHNRVHVWVGGSMLPSTSPNDPVFFLNHAKEDELWAVWCQKHPTVPHYLPADSYPLPGGHNHLIRLSDHMEALAEYFGGATIDRPVDLIDHKAITWYDTDLPDITLESGPAIAFNDTPSGLTAAKMIRFRVASCRPVTFSVTGSPTGNFSVVGGPDFTVTPMEANDFEILEIEVRFLAQGPNVQVSAVDIEAKVLDEEGYYAANPNDPYVVKTFHIELVANNIVTSDSSIVLVLDRSGSMSDVANSGFTKHELMKSAVGVVHELLKDNDQIGIARFDHEADVLLPMTAKSAGLGTVLTGPGLDPRGATSIGAGITAGSPLLNGPGATHPNKAMIVLTDGNENYPPMIAGLPAGTINQTTFAIGLGLPGQVSDPILDQISANSGGYLLVTGDVSSDTERFALAKLFIQILKDATLNETVVDPEGLLLWNGQPHIIPFQVADSDVSIDVVALSPIPFALDFSLVTPEGDTITSAMSGVEPNVTYRVGQDIAYYRLMLPALPSAAVGSHRGQWRAVLGLRDRDEILKHVAGLRVTESNASTRILGELRRAASSPTRYNLTVHSYSNLTLQAHRRQERFTPGSPVHLSATLWEYRVPLGSEARVWADVLQPDGSRAHLPLARSAAGSYEASWPTSLPGVYRFTVRAEGRTGGLAPFSREKVLTAGVWAGADQPVPGEEKPGDSSGALLCCLFEDLMGSRGVRRRLKAAGLDPGALRKCLEAYCRGRSPSQSDRPVTERIRTTALPELTMLAAEVLGNGPEARRMIDATPTVPVVRRPQREGSNENMFVRPEQEGEPTTGHGHDPKPPRRRRKDSAE